MGKEKIIKNIKAGKPKNRKIISPDYLSHGNSKDLVEVFRTKLKQVGCNLTEIEKGAQVKLLISNKYKDALNFSGSRHKKRVSDNWELSDLMQLACVIIDGKFGVAENGAIWVENSNFPSNYIPFIAEKLVVILDRKDIVMDMHNAYDRIEHSRFEYGVFISGPSKTADIDQCLVYGAQGAIQMDVLLIN